MKRTERIDKARTEQLRELLTLLVSEARIHVVRLRILKVNIIVRHIEVAADNDRLAAVKLKDVSAEGILPLHAVGKALQSVLRVWHIDGDEIEVGHLKSDDATLMVVLLNAQTVGHRQRLVFGIDSRTGIAFLLGIVPVGCVTRKLKVKLSSLHLRLLKAEEIRVERKERPLKVFPYAGTQTVYIPRNKFHNKSPQAPQMGGCGKYVFVIL